MSKDKCRMSRKRFCKKAAGKHGVQVQEVRDMVREGTGGIPAGQRSLSHLDAL